MSEENKTYQVPPEETIHDRDVRAAFQGLLYNKKESEPMKYTVRQAFRCADLMREEREERRKSTEPNN